jgi:uncharacterized LabA/DUF88 family protein
MTPSVDSSIRRVYVYVDGFNFYHATTDTEAYPYGWCNWLLTAQNYCGQSRRVVGLKYFTSLVSTSDEEKTRRQKLHIAAMETIGKVVHGRFVPRERVCRQCGFVEHFNREKKTDTNIAVHMVLDAAMNRYDEAFLVTADMDLLPAVEAGTNPNLFRKPKPVTVLFPPHADTSNEFLAGLDSLGPAWVRPIEMKVANIVRFPVELAAKLGYQFPAHWALGSSGPPVSPPRSKIRPRVR